jgi:hypothetical protein
MICISLSFEPSALSFSDWPTFLGMTPATSFNPFLNNPESLFVDPFSGTYGNQFNLFRFFDPVDDSGRTDSKTSQP